ncbi:hypothetical protein K474DRAFT_1699992, partial [Panus rudis PR-1116 ss-1]
MVVAQLMESIREHAVAIYGDLFNRLPQIRDRAIPDVGAVLGSWDLVAFRPAPSHPLHLVQPHFLFVLLLSSCLLEDYGAWWAQWYYGNSEDKVHLTTEVWDYTERVMLLPRLTTSGQYPHAMQAVIHALYCRSLYGYPPRTCVWSAVTQVPSL